MNVFDGKIYLKTKVSNMLQKEAKKEGISIIVELQNILVNGEKRGCSGFVYRTDGETPYVYLNTEHSVLASTQYLHRYARSNKDYTGLRNRFSKSCEAMVKDIIWMLKSEQ